MTTRIVFGAIAALIVLTAQAADPAEKTRELISVLQSSASLFEKARACQQLGEIGTAEAVPPLAALLADPQLNSYARSGLEGIPDPSAAAALREAAGKLKGPLLIGVINSLGVLRDTQAVELLSKLATEPNSGAANGALLALGNIASPESIRTIQQVLAKGPESSRPGAAAACLLAADRVRTEGKLEQAVVLYDALRSPKLPTTYRVAATRGAILSRKSDRLPFLMEQLSSGEVAIRNAALLTIREIPDDALAAALNAELPNAKPELQGEMLTALIDCHNSQSIAAVEKLASDPNPEIRRTALMVLGRLGPPAAPALVSALEKEQTAEERAAVLEGLKGMPGAAVDDLLIEKLGSARTAKARKDLIQLLDSRGAVKASGELLKQAAGPEREIRIAALSALHSLAGAEEVPALVALTGSCTDEEVRTAAEIALVGACTRSHSQPSGAELVFTALKQATETAQRNSWIRVLAAVGYAPALPDIEAAARDSNEEVARNALTQLGRWPDPAPIEFLLERMETAAVPTLRNRALLSVLDLATTAADEAQRPKETIVNWLRRTDSSAKSIQEKRRIVGLLGRLETVESFRLLSSHLEEPDLRTEAASGIIQIAPVLAKEPQSGELKSALQKIAAAGVNRDLRDRALRAAKDIPSQEAVVRLFDGRSLVGWEGDTKVWRVSEGAITGGSMAGNPRNEFLATEKSYTNFVLRVEYKLVGTEGFVNSGVQFRSERVSNPPNEMSGYQADIGAGYSGCLYDESRRNKFLARYSEAVMKRLEKPGDWNRYELRCEGPHIQIWLNGEKTVDYAETDGTISQTGHIGLQIHGGNKAQVFFRNITLQVL